MRFSVKKGNHGDPNHGRIFLDAIEHSDDVVHSLRDLSSYYEIANTPLLSTSVPYDVYEFFHPHPTSREKNIDAAIVFLLARGYIRV